jgi:putative transcription factor|tara:strand:+ start:200 stop:646 length:447 start_codon:yes stop_codon:yes gene_type:complete
MCGSEGKLYRTIIESAKLKVCHECSKYGKVVEIVKEETFEKAKEQAINKEQEKEIIDVVVEDFADRIKKKREQLNLTQKDFAKKISEKESIIHKIETGNFIPQMELTKRLERFLHIKLTEQHEEKHEKQAKADTGSVTIGDLINIKRK